MTSTTKQIFRYLGAVLIVAAASGVADLFSRITGTSRLTSIFLSSVLLAAFYLGTGPGYLAAGLALLAHLYLVDPPYQFSLGSVDEINALALFLVAAILTCLLAGRVREEAAAARARSRTAATLLEATRELSAAADEAFIRQRLAERLHAMAGGEAVLFEGGRVTAPPAVEIFPEELHSAAEAERLASGQPPETRQKGGWNFRGLVAGDQAFGVAGWRLDPSRGLAREETAALDLLTDTGAAAIARARLAAAKADAETRARTEDLRNALLSSISHDLRTPLSSIMGSATTLKRFAEEFDVATRRDLAATIEEEAARLDAFVSNLLQMTRLQSGAVRLTMIPFDLAEAVHTAVARHGAAKGAAFEVSMAAGLPEALGDPALFGQALGNVLDNALRYAWHGGGIAVRVIVEGDRLAVEVADRGPGVAEADLERIFEKFFRAEAGAKVVGTGLGLSIARGLMEAMRGEVVAQPRADGGSGLTVRLTLPRASA